MSLQLVHDPAVHRTGALLNVKTPRIWLRDYVSSHSVFNSAPESFFNSCLPGHGPRTVPLAMYLNDTLGDCTCAGVGNTLRVNSLGKIVLTDNDIQVAYVAVTGEEGGAYDPETGANADAGCVPIDVLDYWVGTGVGGDKLLGHAGVDMSNPNEARWALWTTGSLYQGINLAVEQQTQAMWDYVPGSNPGSWGGHLFPLFDHPEPYRWVGGTWGTYKMQTTEFMLKQATESHALITDGFLEAHADVVDVEKLRADLGLLKAES